MRSRETWNPVNPFDNMEIDWDVPPENSRVQVFEDDSKGILSENKSPDLPFRYSLNPYRGCTHGCVYCYARRTHEFLGLGAGSDFDTKIMVKIRAPELLRQRLMKPSWQGERINISGITDPYQPLEGRYKLMRRCLEVCVEFRQPLVILTRSPLILRDLDLLAELASHSAVRVYFSIPILDEEICRKLEPGTAMPRHRLRAISTLSSAGIPTGVSVSPLIPGLNVSSIPNILKAARDAGARHAFTQLLRLPGNVESYFTHRIRQVLPDKSDKVLNGLKRMREGRLNGAGMSTRRVGVGEEWNVARQLYELWHRKLGYEKPEPVDQPSPFRRPGSQEQLSLF